MSTSKTCINLKEKFGKRYRVNYEESYYAERTKDSLVDPWMMIIPCRYPLSNKDVTVPGSVENPTGTEQMPATA